MTSRQPYTSHDAPEAPLSPAQGATSPPPPSDISPAVPAHIIIKLLAFTFAMVTIPLGSFFFTRAYVFRGSSIYSGAFAALMANVVLIAYVLVAVAEDQGEEGGEGKGKGKKKAQ